MSELEVAAVGVEGAGEAAEAIDCFLTVVTNRDRKRKGGISSPSLNGITMMRAYLMVCH